jgi:hypothetical protein
MPKTLLTGLALIALLGCGSKKQSPATPHSKAAAPAAHRAATRTSTQSRTQRKLASRPDTATTRNPLTNH